MSDVENSTIFEKNFLARDIALTIDSVYASPQDLVYVYAENTSEFHITIKKNKVRVKAPLQEGEEVEKIFWFADENKSRLDVDEPFTHVNNLEFIKTSVGGQSFVDVVDTILIIPVLPLQPTYESGSGVLRRG